jgi:hypothetical protein
MQGGIEQPVALDIEQPVALYVGVTGLVLSALLAITAVSAIYQTHGNVEAVIVKPDRDYLISKITKTKPTVAKVEENTQSVFQEIPDTDQASAKSVELPILRPTESIPAPSSQNLAVSGSNPTYASVSAPPPIQTYSPVTYPTVIHQGQGTFVLPASRCANGSCSPW